MADTPVSQSQRIYQSNLQANTEAAFSGAPVMAQPEATGFFGQVADVWMQETWVGNAMKYGLYRKDNDTLSYDYSPDFNPYKYYLNNKEEYGNLQPHVLNGLFDDVFSEEQFKDRAKRLIDEYESRKSISEGSGAGAIVGGLLSFADVSTFIPGINVFKKAKTASAVTKLLTSRPVRFGATGAYVSAVQEAGLHAFQDLRTLEESEMNTIFGAGFGGVLGTAAAMGGRTSLLNPKSPDYLFNPNTKVMMGVKSMGQAVSESPAIAPVIRGGKNTWEAVSAVPLPGTGGSVGAAAVKGIDVVKAGGEKVAGVAGRAVQAVGKAGQAVVSSTIAKATPIGRGLVAASEKARMFTARLYDLGGILLDGHQRGYYIKSFEDVAEGFKRNIDMLQIQVRESYVGLQMKLAEMEGKSVSAAGVAARDVGTAAKSLFRDIGAGAGASGRPRNTDFGARTGRLERFEFEDLIESSMREDITPEITANLESRFGKEGAQEILNTAKRIGEGIHEHNLRIEDELVKAGLLRDADRLGRNFVAPQLWSGKGVRANKARAKEFFMRLFANEPSDEFLAANVITREQFDKLGKEPVKIGEKEYGLNDGVAYKNEILGDWSGELRDNQAAQLELRLREAEEDFQNRRRELVLAARELRRTETDIKNASVDEAEAVLKYRLAAREKSKVELDKKRLELQRAQEEVRQAREEAAANDPEKALIAGIENYAGAASGHKTAVKEAEQMYDMMVKDGDPNGIKTAQSDLVDADNALWSQRQLAVDTAKARRDFQTRVEQKRAKAEAKAMEAEGRVTALSKEINKLESRLKRLDGPLEKLLRLTEEAKAARQTIQMVRKLRNKAVSDMRKETGKSKRELKSAQKAARKFKGETIEQYVEKLVDVLSQRHTGMAPLNVIDSAFMETGRTRLRFIKMNNEQLREAKSLGMLRGDLMGRLSEGNTDLGRQIAMREVYGQYGKDNDEIVQNILKEVEEEYDRLILQAEQAGKPRLVRKLQKEQRTFLGEAGGDGDIVKGFKRQFGRLDLPNDPESVLGWVMGKAREFNFIRYGSGFLIASLTDVANVALTSGFGTLSVKTIKGVNRTVSGMSNPEIRRVAAALELIMHNSRNFKINSMDDMRLMSGIGDYGTVKHYLTSNTDRLFNGMSQTTSYMSGMLWWNTRLKMAAMVEMQHNFVEKAFKYDQLLKEASAGNKAAELEIAQLASLGLGSDQMRGVQAMLAKHAPENTDGLYELGMARWLSEGDAGQKAYDDVLLALEHVANRAVMTPGKGDTPFLMSNQYFKMLLQFQTYGFTIMNRFMLPGFQRMANYGDMEAFLSFGLALAMGGVVTASKDLLNDGKIKERSALEWGYDAIDRAGYLAYLSSYLSAGIRMVGGTTSRYSQERNRLAQILGPTGSLIQDTWDVADGVAQGDVDRTTKAAWKLAPLSTYRQVIDLATGQ